MDNKAIVNICIFDSKEMTYGPKMSYGKLIIKFLFQLKNKA